MNPIDLCFLGTSAGTPSRHRNVTACALRCSNGAVWLFDCGEATQHQLLRSSIRPNAIRRICISHLHGDHCYGIFGLLASLAIHGRGKIPLHLIGPQGLRAMVHCVLQHSALHLPYPLNIDELPPDGADFHDQGWCLSARPIAHRVPCFGFLIVEPDAPGRLNAQRAQELGVPAGPERQVLLRGERIVLANGRQVSPEEVVGPPRPGRRLVILGDTNNPESLLASAAGCDVLVHEATFAAAEQTRAQSWGHSTSSMAGLCAQAMGARHLILTHFSSRYPEADANDPEDRPAKGLLVRDLQQEAQQACPDCLVHIAADLRIARLGVTKDPDQGPDLTWHDDRHYLDT